MLTKNAIGIVENVLSMDQDELFQYLSSLTSSSLEYLETLIRKYEQNLRERTIIKELELIK